MVHFLHQHCGPAAVTVVSTCDAHHHLADNTQPVHPRSSAGRGKVVAASLAQSAPTHLESGLPPAAS